MFFIKTANNIDISTKRTIDREIDPKFKFTVSVTYIGAYNITDNATVTVTVTNLNDNLIEVISFDPINVTEGAPSGGVVGQVVARDNDTDSNLEYFLISPSNVLSINQTTGVILLAKMIDRETLQTPIPCSPAIVGANCYNITATVRDITSGQSVVHLSVLMVTDIDDEPPVFSANTYTATISENTPVNTIVKLNITATDPDLSALLSFSLDPSIVDFSIASNTGQLSVAGQLDYEKKPNTYTFDVTVTDTNGNSADATVIIYITDYNDNTPVFDQDVYTADAEEGTSMGGVFVVIVTANDADSLPNAMITYSITSGNNDSIFAINPLNGIITVVGTINYKQHSSHTLVIVAVDSGNPQLSNMTTVEITIVDIKDNSPVFTATQFIGVVNETATVGDPVLDSITRLPLLASATDADINATVTITSLIVGSFPFSVHSTTGAITVSAGRLDHETQSVYKFFVIATDEFGISSVPVNVTIMVFDGDDNVPVFGMSVYNIDLGENRSQGYLITTINAIGTTGPVLYMLEQQNPMLPFEIGASTGQITVNGTLDYESGITNYQFVVSASSNNFVTKDNATVHIAILDINDEPPVFVAKMYTVSVDENSIQDIIRVNATDADTNAVIRYQQLSGNTSFFEINDITGMIRTSQELDYEQYQALELVILAFNPDNPALNSTVLVEIVVIDVNDNSPIFSPTTYTVSVPEFALSGYVVVNTTASDADTFGSFGTVTYSIATSVPTPNIFTIDESTGTISVASTKLQSRQQTPTYVLQVSARDGGSPHQETTALVLITVTDVNEQPVFTQNSYTVKQPEDIPNGTVILQVKAAEAGDVGTNSKITYSIIIPNGYTQDPDDMCNNTTEMCSADCLVPFHINCLLEKSPFNLQSGKWKR